MLRYWLQYLHERCTMNRRYYETTPLPNMCQPYYAACTMKRRHYERCTMNRRAPDSDWWIISFEAIGGKEKIWVENAMILFVLIFSIYSWINCIFNWLPILEPIRLADKYFVPPRSGLCCTRHTQLLFL